MDVGLVLAGSNQVGVGSFQVYIVVLERLTRGRLVQSGEAVSMRASAMGLRGGYVAVYFL